MAKALPILGAGLAGASALAPTIGATLGGLGTAAAGAGAAGAAGAGAAGAGALGGLAAPIAQGLSAMGPMGQIAGSAMTGTLTPEIIMQQGIKQLMASMQKMGQQAQQGEQQQQDPAEQAMQALLQKRGDYDPTQLQAIIGNRSKFGR